MPDIGLLARALFASLPLVNCLVLAGNIGFLPRQLSCVFGFALDGRGLAFFLGTFGACSAASAFTLDCLLLRRRRRSRIFSLVPWSCCFCDRRIFRLTLQRRLFQLCCSCCWGLFALA